MAAAARRPRRFVFPWNADTATIATAFAADYGGNPLVADNGSSGNQFKYRISFRDRRDKNVEMVVDGELYTSEPGSLSITEIALQEHGDEAIRHSLGNDVVVYGSWPDGGPASPIRCPQCGKTTAQFVDAGI